MICCFFSLVAFRIFFFSLPPALNSYGCSITHSVTMLLRLSLVYLFNLIFNNSSENNQWEVTQNSMCLLLPTFAHTILCARPAFFFQPTKILPVLPQIQIRWHFCEVFLVPDCDILPILSLVYTTFCHISVLSVCVFSFATSWGQGKSVSYIPNTCPIIWNLCGIKEFVEYI